MDPKDARSFKLVIVSDYLVNPSHYQGMPSNPVFYEVLQDIGVGVLKLPPLGISEDSLNGWLTITADQIEEYSKRGYRIYLLGAEKLEEGGIWLSRLEKEMNARGITKPPTLLLKNEELNLDKTAASKLMENFLK